MNQPTHTQARILAVDDEEANLLLLQRILQKDGYTNLQTLLDSRRFAEVFQQFQPDLILLDLMMPYVDGFAILKQLPELQQQKYLPVLVLTADVTAETKQKALANGAKDFLTKPLDAVEVLLRLRNLLETRFLYLDLARQNQTLEEQVRQRTWQVMEQASLIDLASDAIMVIDLDCRIRFWSKGAERVYGWSAAEAVGQQAPTLFCRMSEPLRQQALQGARETGSWQGEVAQVAKNGRELAIHSRWTLLRDQAGRPKSLLLIDTDVTEKKQLEKQFLRAQRLESLGVLAGGIAHDLNNMLTPVLMSVQLFRTKLTDALSQAMLTNLESSVERAAGMVKQILTFARGTSGAFLPMELTTLLKELSKMLKQSFPKDVEIKTNVPRDLWPVSGDATQLYQVLMNLCVNARDAMPKGGALTITAENVTLDCSYAAMHAEAKPGPYVLLKVADTGSGIPAQVLCHIFEPFFTTKEQGKGTGLGLATVYNLVTQHGGFVVVSTQVDQGSEFAIYLPALPAAAAAKGSVSEDQPQGHGEGVLVVDDESTVRQIFQTTLESNGYKVFSAADGTEALALFVQKNKEIKVILLDMVMPYLDGPSTIRALHNLNPQVPIVAFSGITKPAELGELGQEVKEFLVKPFTAGKLLQTLQQAMRR